MLEDELLALSEFERFGGVDCDDFIEAFDFGRRFKCATEVVICRLN